MTLLSYFLFKTGIVGKIQSVTKYVKIDGKKIKNFTTDENTKYETFELGHKIYKNNDNVICYQTFFPNGEKIVLNHLSKHDRKGNLIELNTYYGDNTKYDSTLDVCYIIDLINETLSSVTNEKFWDEVIINDDDTLNFEIDENSDGYLISKNPSHHPKKVKLNGEIVGALLGNETEICYVDYLKYNDMNIFIYCQKYDISKILDNSEINITASDIAKRKIIGNCVIVSNDNLTEELMGKIVINALNFNQKEYEEKQKKDLIKMYAQAYVIQHPK